MKNLKYALVLLLAFFAFGNVSNAATTLPDDIKTDEYKIIEYIKNYPIVVKTAENHKYIVYCMNQTAKYDGNVTFDKVDVVDPGFKYILKNRPNTGNEDKDFYITQMAVWYYQDLLNYNNDNIPKNVKAHIIALKEIKDNYDNEEEEVCAKINALYKGAKNYVEANHEFKFGNEEIILTKDGEFYVSNEIIVDKQNVGNIEYQLANAPAGSVVVAKDNSVIVKVPVSSVTDDVEFTLTGKADYTKEDAYYYHTEGYQRLLFEKLLETPVVLSDVKTMKISIDKKFTVKISKTDITQSKEVEGATLVVKDESGSVVETWVSTNTVHNITLAPGKYSLTETIAPKGYKLSSTTIEFMVANNGAIYVKDDGVYVSVDKINMINELIDVVAINKVDSKTNKLISGAKLVIKDTNGNVVKSFVSNGKTYYVELDPGYYTISETEAPKGYVLSKNIIYFYLGVDGTLKIKNESGKYVESALITFKNTKEVKKEVIVPATGLNSYTTLIGIVLLASGIICVKKFNKEY